MFWLDTVILIVLGVAAIWGAFAGLLWQLSRIITVVLALYCTITFNEIATSFLLTNVMADASPLVGRIVAYVLVFLLVCLVFLVITMNLEKSIEKVKLQWLNRLMGAVSATIKAGFLVGVVLYGLNYFPGVREGIERSQIAPVLTKGVDFAFRVVPEHYRENVDSSLDNTAQTVESFQNTSNITFPKKPKID